MKLFLHQFLILTCFRSLALAGYVVDLDASSEVKALFDGGLRPIHQYGLEMSDLELPEPTEVSFSLGGITTPPLLAEWSFRVFYDRGLSDVKGYSRQPWSKDQAYAELSKWETALGYGSQLPALRQWLDRFPHNEGSDLWGRKVFKNLPKVTRYISYYLRHSFQEEKPLLMTVHVSWIIEGPQPIIFGKEPLKPPPGYEDHDMRSLEKRAEDESFKKWNAQQAELKVSSPPKSGKTASPLTKPETTESNWWKWGLVILALAFLGRMIWKRWKSAPYTRNDV